MRQKRIKFYMTALILASLVTETAQANPITDAKQEIQATIVRRAQARQRLDLNGYMATFTPDWEVVNVSGKAVSYNRLRKSMAANLQKSSRWAKITWKIMQLDLRGQTAQVTIATVFKYPPVQMPKGPVYCTKTTVAAENWVKSPAGWQEQHERYLVDDVRYAAKP